MAYQTPHVDNTSCNIPGFDPNAVGVVHIDPDERDGGVAVDFGALRQRGAASANATIQTAIRHAGGRVGLGHTTNAATYAVMQELAGVAPAIAVPTPTAPTLTVGLPPASWYVRLWRWCTKFLRKGKP